MSAADTVSEPGSQSSSNLLENLIIDSGAIIKGCGFDFHKVAKRFWTVQEVLAEIRDSKSLHLLETLPFELEIRVPSDKAMKAVAEFSRKTNDFAALSLTDLKLIALTYQFEVRD
jgi:RNA-binding protein NOB1